MDSRLKLHNLLLKILDGKDVYYQPPESIKICYPAIIYSRSDIMNTNADNRVYKQDHFYKITVIDPNPDSQIVDRISKLPKINFDSHYTSDGLNHDVFTLYYD